MGEKTKGDEGFFSLSRMKDLEMEMEREWRLIHPDRSNGLRTCFAYSKKKPTQYRDFGNVSMSSLLFVSECIECTGRLT